MIIKLKDKNSFINNFLRPISSMSDNVVIKSVNNKLLCLSNNEQGLILCATYNISLEDTIQLNIPNVKRLEKVISFINTTEIDLQYRSNALSYKDKNIRFKYHFLDDNIIQTPKLSLNKINSIEHDIEFTIDNSKITELSKGAAFVSESEKLYFNISDDGIYGEITDKTNSSVDSYSILLNEQNIGKEISFPVHFDIVRLLSNSNSTNEINVKINTTQGLCIFTVENDDSVLKYIVPGLQS